MTNRKIKKTTKPKMRVSFGTLAFAGIFVAAYAAIWFPANAAETLLLTAVLGIAVAIFNMHENPVFGMPKSEAFCASVESRRGIS